MKSKQARLEAKNKRRKARQSVSQMNHVANIFKAFTESEIVSRKTFVLNDACVENKQGCCLLIHPITVECATNATGDRQLHMVLPMDDGSYGGTVTTKVCDCEDCSKHSIRRHAKRIIQSIPQESGRTLILNRK